MRTTLDIPEELVEEAKRLLGFKSKTDVVIVALREVIRRRRLDELKDLAGAIELDIDLRRSRRRPRRKSL
jgi:Arc/MetJ family transcription regulator